MSAPYVYTYSDAIEAMNDFLAGQGVSVGQSTIRRAIRAAYRKFATAHDWSFLIKPGRIELKAAETTGTVTYDETGHVSGERALVLSDSTWPSDAQDWCVRLAEPEIICDIDQRISDTVVLLDAQTCPVADIATGVEYTAYPRWYRLPNDFVSLVSRPMEEDPVWQLGQYVSPAEMEVVHRYEDRTGDVERYTIAAIQDLFGAMGIYVWPPSDTNETCDFVYRRRPRDMRYSGHDDGEILGVASISQDETTVTGSADGNENPTTFSSNHVGSIFRPGTASYRPDGLDGIHPYGEQHSIKAVASTTSLTLDAAATATYTNVKYQITDPWDMDVACWDAFLQCCESELARIRRMENSGLIHTTYLKALRAAKAADRRVSHRRVAGSPYRYVTRLAYGTDREDID